jgi:REP element-mobilizing transposase RayT
MRDETIKPNRRSIRLPEYDYRQAEAYFVTICTRKRECLLGEIKSGEMLLSEFGGIVKDEWHRTKRIRPHVNLDAFIIMPNHIHGIIVLKEDPIDEIRRGTMDRAPTPKFERFGKPTSNSIPTIIRGFKSSVTQRVNELRGTFGETVWQRNYYEHVIRNEIDLDEIRQYIENNPFKWLEDENHPANIEPPNRRGTMHRAPILY